MVKAGYEYWVEDVNRRGGLLGRPVRMTIYDDESNADKAVTYYERAVTVDKVDLVFGGYPATSNVALMPLMEKYGKVFIGLGGQLKAFEQVLPIVLEAHLSWPNGSICPLPADRRPHSKAEWPKSIAFSQ